MVSIANKDGQPSPSGNELASTLATASPSSTNAEATSSARISGSSGNMNLCFAMRPTASGYAAKCDWNQPVSLKANSYKLKMQ